MIFSISSNDSVMIKQLYDESMAELDSFFNIGWVRNKPRVFIIDNKETLKKFPRTHDWVIGWTSNNNAYLLGPDNFKSMPEGYFKSLLKHELAHLFIKVLSRDVPKWFDEGLAISLSGQLAYNTPIKRFKNLFSNDLRQVYYESGFAVELLTKTYGKESIIKLLKSESFNDSFKSLFNSEPSIEYFNQLIISNSF